MIQLLMLQVKISLLLRIISIYLEEEIVALVIKLEEDAQAPTCLFISS